MRTKFKKVHLFAVILLVAVYFFTRLFQLTKLPVFADEAIYLRWSQLIISNPKQYLFFPMNDGKTPLQIWLNVPFLLTFNDPLWAGRLLTVLVGGGQIAALAALIKSFGGSKKLAFFGACLVVILPGWFLHQRLALLDGLLTLWLSLSFLFVHKALLALPLIKDKKNRQHLMLPIILAGVFFGAALWTKFAALLFLPVILISSFLFNQQTKLKIFSHTWWQKKITALVTMLISAGLGGALFLLLKFTPVFSQIFARGGDFLHPLSIISTGEIWSILARNSLNFISYLANFATGPFLITTLILALLTFRQNRQPFYLLLCALVFLAPITLLGKVVYPRYLLPALIFITLAGVLSSATWWRTHRQQSWRFLPALALIPTFIISTNFIATSYFDLAHWPLVAADREQYLATWSAGFGIPETTTLIQKIIATEKTLVLTEGYFGTLPDALLMYFFNQDVHNLAIEGIGQPIVSIPDQELARFTQFDRILVVANSNRFQLPTDQLTLLASYSRPVPDHVDGFIDLQVWEINKNYVQN